MNYTKYTEGFNSERWSFNAAGVTFRNEDGTERQEIISHLYGNTEYTVRIERFEYQKNPAYRILVDGQVIGSVPKNVASQFAEKEDVGFWIWPVSLGVHGGPALDDDFDAEDFDDVAEELSYGAHVVVKLISPEEQKAKNMSIGDDGTLHQERPDNPLDHIDGCDELLLPATKAVLDANEASTAVLQRSLKIGYSQAAKLLDEMESYNIVGPFTASESRAILVTSEQLDEKIGEHGVSGKVITDTGQPASELSATKASVPKTIQTDSLAPQSHDEKLLHARRSANAAKRVRKIALWIALALVLLGILISKLPPIL
jgi:hypothetical protein